MEPNKKTIRREINIKPISCKLNNDKNKKPFRINKYKYIKRIKIKYIED